MAWDFFGRWFGNLGKSIDYLLTFGRFHFWDKPVQKEQLKKEFALALVKGDFVDAQKRINLLKWRTGNYFWTNNLQLSTTEQYKFLKDMIDRNAAITLKYLEFLQTNDFIVDCVGAGPNEPLLIYAIEKENTEIVLAFIKAGVNVNRAGTNGRTALMLAAEKGKFDIVNELLKREANVHEMDDFCINALMRAREKGHMSVADALIKKGAYCNDKNNNSSTAIKSENAQSINLEIKIIDKSSSPKVDLTYGSM